MLSAIKMVVLAFTALASVAVLNDYAVIIDLRRGLCENGEVEEAKSLLSTPRGLKSSIIAYIDTIINADEDPCQTSFPNVGIFAEYPPLSHGGGNNIPQRPLGTYAYAIQITRCPEWYSSTVQGSIDPGDNLYEASAIIKDEICNATATNSLLTNKNDPGNQKGQTL